MKIKLFVWVCSVCRCDWSAVAVGSPRKRCCAARSTCVRSAAPTCVTAASTSARGRWAVQSVHMSLKKILLTIFLAIIACSIKMQLLYPPVAMVVVVGGGGYSGITMSFCPFLLLPMCSFWYDCHCWLGVKNLLSIYPGFVQKLLLNRSTFCHQTWYCGAWWCSAVSSIKTSSEPFSLLSPDLVLWCMVVLCCFFRRPLTQTCQHILVWCWLLWIYYLEYITVQIKSVFFFMGVFLLFHSSSNSVL